MKISHLLLIILLACAATFGQEIPSGVRYKKASDAVNNTSKANLENAIISDSLPKDLFSDATVVGPMLWKSLKASANPVLLKTTPVMLIVPGGSLAEGKNVRTDEQRNAFWNVFRNKFPTIKDGKVRKGKAEEISYYWATIPFDIEEPFWVIECGSDRFITDFEMKDGKPRLLWIDLVGDLRTLKN